MNLCEVNASELKIPQILSAFEFECDRPNDNLATVCHQITIRQLWQKPVEWPNGNSTTVYHWIAIHPFKWLFLNLTNGNSVTNSHQIAIRPITLKLKSKRNLSNSECINAMMSYYLSHSCFISSSTWSSASTSWPIFRPSILLEIFLCLPAIWKVKEIFG